MTDQTARKTPKGYNLTVTPTDAPIDTTPTQAGLAKTKFRATLVQRGRTVERTVVAQGAAAALIDGMIVAGNPVALRCVYNTAPGQDGKKGGEFLAVVALPREKKAA